jgi:hypothetical protein
MAKNGPKDDESTEEGDPVDMMSETDTLDILSDTEEAWTE